MSEEASERTPLLAEPATVADPPVQAETSGETDNNNSASPDHHYARFRRPFVILTSFYAFLSVLAFVTSAATGLVLTELLPPGYYLNWGTTDLNSTMVVTTAFAALISIVNLIRLHNDNRPTQLLFNFLCELIFMAYLFAFSVEILAYAVSSEFPCHKRRGRDDGDEASCLPIAIVVRTLLIISSGSELVLGFVILALFLMRCVLVHRLRPWNAIQRSNGRWTVPTGVLTFEFSIKFLRQEERIETDRSEERV